jgi:hypothetical protein
MAMPKAPAVGVMPPGAFRIESVKPGKHAVVLPKSTDWEAAAVKTNLLEMKKKLEELRERIEEMKKDAK